MAGIIIGTLAVAVPVEGQVFVDTAYTWPDYARLSVYGAGPDSVHLLAHNDDEYKRYDILGLADFERLTDAYVTAYPNPYIEPQYPFDGWSYTFDSNEHIPYVHSNGGIASYDSAVLVLPVDHVFDDMCICRLNGDAWQPLASRIEYRAVPYVDTIWEVSAHIDTDGFYAAFRYTGSAFAIEEYLSSYPNPFYPRRNEQATIAYFLAGDADVVIRIFSRTGAIVRTMEFEAGTTGGHGTTAENGLEMNRVTWDGRNEQGRLVEPGGYRCILSVGDLYRTSWKIGVLR